MFVREIMCNCGIWNSLPFGATEHFSLEQDVSSFEPAVPSRSSRARSEPKSSKSRKSSSRSAAAAGGASVSPDRAKSVERSLVVSSSGHRRSKKHSAPASSHMYDQASAGAWGLTQEEMRKDGRHRFR